VVGSDDQPAGSCRRTAALHGVILADQSGGMAVGRYAPSPSGPLHLGNLRTALIAWLCARSSGSTFLLRVEDLDPGATREEHVRSHQRDLQLLGLGWDGPVVRQSERFDLYEQALARLETDGLLYPCYCSRREVLEAAQAPHDHLPEGAYPGTCRELSAGDRAAREAEGRTPAWRLRAASERVRFVDRLAGPCEGELDDFVVRRRDGTPAYNLAVVVDDAEQGVEEVVRGDDLLATTPRQIHLARLLGLEPPTHVHVPLVLGPDGERLAKRHGAVTLDDRRALGQSPVALLVELGASLGLMTTDEPAPERPDAVLARLLGGFAVERLPRAPWVVGR
jgi:glutamyl-tRNA synthetase